VPDPIDDFRALNDPVRRRQVERRGSFFVVEGIVALEALLDSPYTIRTVLVAGRKAERVRDLVRGRAPVVVRSDREVAEIAGFDFHRGVLASAERRSPPEVAPVVAGAALVAVVEGVADHENLGALFRNAAALSVDAVLLDPTTADPLYRRSVRVSLGHVLRVPWARLGRLPSGFDPLRSAGFEVVALTPSPDALPLDALTRELTERHAAGSRGAGVPREGPRLALVVGAEGPGLSPATLDAADRRVRIPLAPGVDSLNVATAAAIAFHALRGVATRGTGAAAARVRPR
jgi:tRNA G18 (ribose-2'-O)-methylase SpoU